MIALLLLATALIIVIESQSFAIHMQSRANRISTATMLARDVMTDLEMRMRKEGFGELEVHESGDFNDERYGGHFEGYRWEYEVEKVEFELSGLSSLMGLADEGSDVFADAAGLDSGGAAGGGNELAALEGMGVDMSFFGEMMGNYLREARVRVCFPDGLTEGGQPAEDCLEVTQHLTNPTGKVLTAEEQALLEAQGENTLDYGSER
jgi:hypothetical protein